MPGGRCDGDHLLDGNAEVLAERVAELRPRPLLQLALVVLREEDRQALEIGDRADVAGLGPGCLEPSAVETAALEAEADGLAGALVAQGGQVRHRWRGFYQTAG